jgi:hypothetical protein
MKGIMEKVTWNLSSQPDFPIFFFTTEIAFSTLCTGTAVEISLQSIVMNDSSVSCASPGQGKDFLINLSLY